jgi:subtilisin family serine protease
MERNANDNRNTLTIPTSGNYPSYIGGSSAATATAAGIAALVWSNKPYMTRAQVMNCLKTTSQYYPAKDWDTGYGNLNASAAVAASNSY